MTSRAVHTASDVPTQRPLSAEAVVLRALGDAYAAGDGGGAAHSGVFGSTWPTLGGLTVRTALDAEAVRGALAGLQRRGLLRVRPRTPPPGATGRRSVTADSRTPQTASGNGPAPAPAGPYSARGSTSKAFASFRTVDG